MKILLANKFYYRRGGAEVYTLNLETLLKNQGHTVAIFTMQHTENLPSPYQKYFPKEVDFNSYANNYWTVLCRPLGCSEVRKNFTALLNDFQPDVVHLGNIHSQLSPIIAKIAHQRGIKVVWTLHDYKIICPRYDCMLNDATPCNRCVKDKTQAVRNRCLKHSLPASVLAYLESVKWNIGKLQSYTDEFITPSRFMAENMIANGLNKNKITVLNNFIIFQQDEIAKQHSDYYCYVGRLSREKGIRTLIEAARQLPYKLKIIGRGENVLNYTSINNIEFLGYKPWEEIRRIVGQARFTVMPSECYENNPLAVIESLCIGIPVVGANIGGIPELVEKKQNGLLFESGNVEDLKDKIEKMFSRNFDYEHIAKNAMERFSAEKYYCEILKIYEQ
ncbi:MAG: glycosyltransferase [Dysgonamonadaceae bacterium]|jgi:glycosyltransferase involved in cell wall biosynthesis|nr:glycosyltransferase [Dysgonamonadaceae bacterium]